MFLILIKDVILPKKTRTKNSLFKLLICLSLKTINLYEKIIGNIAKNVEIFIE